MGCSSKRCSLPEIQPATAICWNAGPQLYVGMKVHTCMLECRSTGNINELAEDNKQHVKLFNCNFDFTYAEHFHTARFGPGAFIQLLDVLFHESTGRHIEIIRHGQSCSVYAMHCLAN